MRRRELLAGLFAIVVLPRAARAQQAGKMYRIGLLSGASAIGPLDARSKSLVAGLAQRGFVEGRNITFEPRWADGHLDRLGGFAAELSAAKVDVIVTYGYPAALAAKTSAKGTPIVISGAGDPVATGLVEGLSRPGGNLTGVTEVSTELSAKRLEILRDAVPNLRVVAMLWNAADLGMTLRYRAAEDAARVLGIKVQTLGVREPNDFDEAFAAMTRERPDAILMVSDALTVLNRKRVVEFAAANRLPTIFESAALVREGGLMSYGPNQGAIGDRVAELVAHILRGERPADLPLEMPTRFEFVLNLKTARSLGLNLQPALIDRADEVIE
ncbi:MAG TPA: ABC transporter substrate-binding protein [Pseudolabrys sp.]|nr:ABC transporter substrate-binding protein [Pseudolabrys sp.]